jgi:hypothetical protein
VERKGRATGTLLVPYRLVQGKIVAYYIPFWLVQGKINFVRLPLRKAAPIDIDNIL